MGAQVPDEFGGMRVTPHSRALAFCTRMGWDSPADLEAVEGLVREVERDAMGRAAKFIEGYADLGADKSGRTKIGAILWRYAECIRSLAPAAEKEGR